MGVFGMRGMNALHVMAAVGGCVAVTAPSLAGFVPVSTSYSVDARVRIADELRSVLREETFSLTSPALMPANAAFNESRQISAILSRASGDPSANQIASFSGRVAGSASDAHITSSAWMQGVNSGQAIDDLGIARSIDALAIVRFEFWVDVPTEYRFAGTMNGPQSTGGFSDAPLSETVVAFWSASKNLFEFAAPDFTSRSDAGFEVTGTLEPGYYTIQAQSRMRSRLGVSPTNDPYAPLATFELVAVPSPGPFALILFAGLFSSVRRRAQH
jgi:hypothetical protein